MSSIEKIRMIIALMSLMLSIETESSEMCRNLYPIDYRLCDLDGTWKFTMATGPTEPDCSGFHGRAFSDTHAMFTSFGRNGTNVRMQAQLKQRLLQLNSIDPMCKEEGHNKKVAVLDNGLVCFYECGIGNSNDYAQCFTKDGSAPKAKALAALHGFGLKIDSDSLNTIDRSECEEIDSGIYRDTYIS